MIEILNQNLELLATETSTDAGFLIKLASSGFETLAAFNEENFDINPLYNDLQKLFTENSLNVQKITESDSYLYLSLEKKIESFYFEKIYEINSHESIFLLLFSCLKQSYSKQKSAAIRKYINETNKQIKETYNPEAIYSEPANTSVFNIIRGEWFTQNHSPIFSALLETSKDLLFILDENGYIIAVNKSGAQSLDFSDLEMRGKHLLEFVKVEEKPQLMEGLRKTITTGKKLELEVTFIGKYENEIQFHLNCSLIKRGTEIVGMIGTGKNLKELKTLKDKNTDLSNKLSEASRLIEIEKSRSDLYKDVLADLNRLRNDFVSNLSHEFRTPLASIIGFAETLLSDKDMPDEMRTEFNEIILQEGKRLAKLINDILELSRYEQGKIELNKNDFDISELVKTVVEDITPTIENKGLILTCSLPSGPAELSADKEKIRLILYGIFNNSIKYTPSKGRITCMVKDFREEIEVIISDTGAGISEKEFPYIFHKFYHSSKGSKEFVENDMDLVFMKQIVDLHRGIIRIQTEPGKGTSVLIKLPKKLKYK